MIRYGRRYDLSLLSLVVPRRVTRSTRLPFDSRAPPPPAHPPPPGTADAPRRRPARTAAAARPACTPTRGADARRSMCAPRIEEKALRRSHAADKLQMTEPRRRAAGCARRRASAPAASPGPVPRVTASGALLASPARALGVRGGRRGLPGAAGAAGGAPADAGEARPRQTAVEARGGPAPRDGRRGRGFASGSRARAPPARGRVRRARGVTGRHAGALRPTGRRRARARRCAPRRGSSRGREPTHTRFLGWRVGPVVFFLSSAGAGIEI